MVDIIVPVYNGFDVIENCIESVLRHTNLTDNRLILINDASTDERVAPALSRWENRPGVMILHNPQNMGFVKTVNYGMRQSGEHDVLLLNSDTVVTENWLEKIHSAAYSEESIATVTPFSNNASICSICMEIDENNNMPPYLTIEEYAGIVERTSLRQYPRIPAGVGFCMFIKRQVLKEIGLFDEETFAKGYGEEVDFCFRATEYGYCHVLCDDTFIWHKNTVSFSSKEKEKAVEKHQKLLNDRYYKHSLKAYQFILEDPIRQIRDHVKNMAAIHNKKKNILYLLHADFKETTANPVGGTQLHVKDLVTGLREQYNCFVLSRENSFLLLTAYIEDREIEYRFSMGEQYITLTYQSKAYQELITHIIMGFQIDLIHIHHTINHTFDPLYCSQRLGIPTVLTLHDFYYICPTINLLNSDLEYCQGKCDEQMCKVCLKEKLGYHNDILPLWRKKSEQALNACDLLVTPNQSAADLYQEIYPNLQTEIQVVEHGTKAFRCYPEYRPSVDETFNVAFVGSMAPYKGSHLLTQMVRECKDPSVKFHVFGIIGDQELSRLESGNLIKYGRYYQENIVAHLQENKIDLVCILSIWPETYCYTLTESWLANIPVLVLDVGALGQRVGQNGGGWRIELDGSAQQILQKILSIKSDPEEYNRVCRQVREIRLPSIGEMVAKYQEIYRQRFSFDLIKKDVAIDYNRIAAAYHPSDAPPQQDQMIARIHYLENELESIQGSLSWRILRRVWTARIPGKRLVKKLLLRIAK